jgi:hypothetical protein
VVGIVIALKITLLWASFEPANLGSNDKHDKIDMFKTDGGVNWHSYVYGIENLHQEIEED